MSQATAVMVLLIVIGVANSSAQPVAGIREAAGLYHQSRERSLPFQSMIKKGEEALSIAERVHDDSLSNLLHTQLGILFWEDGQFQKAMDHLTRGQYLSLVKGDSLQWAQNTHYKGLVYYYRCLFDSALMLYDQVDKVYGRNHRDSAVAKVKSHKGLIYSAEGKYQLAIQNMIASFQLQESRPEYRDVSIRMDFSSEEAEQLFFKGKLEKDLESLRFIEKGTDQYKLAFTLHNIGLDYLYLQRYADALQYFKQSTNVYQKMNYASLSGDLARAYEGIGLYDSAVFYHNEWAKEVKIRGSQIHLIAAYTNLAKCYSLQKKWKEALTYYEHSAELNRRIGLKRSESSDLKAIALILKEQRRWSEALENIDKSLMIATQIGCIRDQQQILEVKSGILRDLNRDEEALETLSESIAIRDSIAAGENAMQVARLQIEYETEKKGRELQELQSQNLLSEKKIESRNLWIALSVSLLALLTAAGLFYYLRYTQKRKAEALITKQKNVIEAQNEGLLKKNRENEVLLSEIHHRVKNNLQIISSLINLKSRQVSAESAEVLQELNGRIYSMGLIHEKLYRKGDLQFIRLDHYLRELGQFLLSSLGSADHPVRLELRCDEIEINVDHALTCGLICNELFTNSLKYAFAAAQNERVISLELTCVAGEIRLVIFDNGKNPKSSLQDQAKSFGLRFVDQLVTSKLGGRWSMLRDDGFKTIIGIPQLSNGKN